MSVMPRTMASNSFFLRDSSRYSSSKLTSKWSSMALFPRPVTMMMFCMPEWTASSTPYWIMGLSTMGNISLGWALVAGRKRVPSPAAGKTAFRTLAGIIYSVAPGPECAANWGQTRISGAVCRKFAVCPRFAPRSGTSELFLPVRLCYVLNTWGNNSHGIRNRGTLHWNEGHGLCGRLPGGLHPSEEGRDQVRGSRDALYRPGRVHRLRRLRPGVPRIGDFCARRPAREVGRVHRQERGLLRKIGRAGGVGLPKPDRSHPHALFGLEPRAHFVVDVLGHIFG